MATPNQHVFNFYRIVKVLDNMHIEGLTVMLRGVRYDGRDFIKVIVYGEGWNGYSYFAMPCCQVTDEFITELLVDAIERAR